MEQESGSAGRADINSEIAVLLKQIAQGDRSALMTLYNRTGRLLFGIVIRVLGDKTAAEETLLDTYTQIWDQAGSYNPGHYTPLEWLTVVARNRVIAGLHWSKRDKRRQRAAAAGMDSLPTVAPEQQRSARSLIASLVPAQQEILEWAYFSGLSCGEIAAQIGKPIGAVRTHARLALSKLEGEFFPPSGQEDKSISGQP